MTMSCLRSSSFRSAPLTLLATLSIVLLAVVGLLLGQPASARMEGGKYLTAKGCGDGLILSPSSSDGDGCQLWRLEPVGGGWVRLQLKHNRKFVDANHCSDDLLLHPGSTYADGACQHWRLVPHANGWSRLQLKYNQKVLDATRCSDDLALNPGSTWAGGTCQLWRLIPVDGEWSRIKIKISDE